MENRITKFMGRDEPEKVTLGDLLIRVADTIRELHRRTPCEGRGHDFGKAYKHHEGREYEQVDWTCPDCGEALKVWRPIEGPSPRSDR